MRHLLTATAVLAVGCQSQWAQGPSPGSAAKQNAASSGGQRSGGSTQAKPGQKNAPKKNLFGGGVPMEFEEIAKLEDRRSFGDGKLLTWAAHTDARVRVRALRALGRIQDSAATPAIEKALTDTDAAVRAEAAFAAGLLGLSWTPLADEPKAKLVEAVLAADVAEADLKVKLALMDALGRLATAPAVERLSARLAQEGEIAAHAAQALGLAARAKVELPAKVFTELLPLVKKEQPQGTRYGACYALAASKNVLAKQGLVSCAQDDAAEVRALAAKGLGDVGVDVDAVTLKPLLDDPDYRTAAEATRALAKLAARCKAAACPAIGALSELSVRVERVAKGDTAGGGQPLLALAQQGLPPTGKPLLVKLRGELQAGLKATADSKVKASLANLDCRLAGAIDRQTGVLHEVLSCGDGLVNEAQRLALTLNDMAEGPAVGDPVKRAHELGSYVLHAEARVKIAALNVLGHLKAPLALERIRPQLSNSDPVVVAAAALALAEQGDKAAIPQLRALAAKSVKVHELAPALAQALAKLDAKDAVGELEPYLQSVDANVRAEGAAALTKLKGMPVTALRVERPAEKGKLPSAPADAVLTVRTAKGDFTVKLDTEGAPLTSANLYALAKKGYFANQTFHRVVPNFVAQGGDPRGDGEGGPGYSIRCELNTRPYVRGTVGMALSGKDTGGSQFFVTVTTMPHLDGRYTAFGEVTQGQEIVDQLLEGDKIIEVRVAP